MRRRPETHSSKWAINAEHRSVVAHVPRAATRAVPAPSEGHSCSRSGTSDAAAERPGARYAATAAALGRRDDEADAGALLLPAAEAAAGPSACWPAGGAELSAATTSPGGVAASLEVVGSLLPLPLRPPPPPPPPLLPPLPLALAVVVPPPPVPLPSTNIRLLDAAEREYGRVSARQGRLRPISTAPTTRTRL